MSALKNRCPNCGGRIVIATGQNYGVCEYCDSRFTLSELQKLEQAQRLAKQNAAKASKEKAEEHQSDPTPKSFASLTTEELCNNAETALTLEIWNVVYDYCDEIIKRDPEFGKAYLYRMLADLKLCNKEDLLSLDAPFDNNANYKLIMRVGDEYLKTEIQNYSDVLKSNLNARALENRYARLCREMESAKGAAHFKYLANSFLLLQGYKDSAERCIKCKEKYQIRKKKNTTVIISVLLILSILAFVVISSVSCAVTNTLSQYSSERFDFMITSKRNDDYNSSYVYLIFDYTISSDSDREINYFCGYMTIKNKDGRVLTQGDIKLSCSVAPEGEYAGAIRWQMTNDDEAVELWNMDYSELEILFRITRIDFENGTVKTYENTDKVIKRRSR